MPNLSIGSHIKVSRGFYTHHGIYCGDDTVIHYSGMSNGGSKGGITETSLEEFLGDAPSCQIVHYADSDIKYSRSEVIQRAYSRIGEDDYNLIFNNCEGFACWCITGKNESRQVQTVSETVSSITLAHAAHITLQDATRETARQLISSTIAPSALSTVSRGALTGAITGLKTSTVVGVGASTAAGATALAAVGIATAPVSVPIVATVAICTAVGGFIGSLFD